MTSSIRTGAADRAFLLAVIARGDLDEAEVRRFFPDLARRSASEREFLKEFGPSPEEALSVLRAEARAQRGPDRLRVHPSWIRRALQAESPAVRRLLVARGPAWLSDRIRCWFPETPTFLDHEPDSGAAALAAALWSERLVGDVPVRDDDPPVVTLITQLGSSDAYRVVECLGLMKLAYVPAEERPSLSRRKAVIIERLAPRSSKNRDKLVALARAELVGSGGSRAKRVDILLGLASIGRLCGEVDPYRLRWALQHLPYPAAKRIRAALSHPLAGVASVLNWDARLLRAAARYVSSRPDASETLRRFA